ncbi:MAG TPA: DNA sulfur modification protein DndB [Acidobacteriaceae bacterium]|jgi:hypothetical protein|nr:DNA sulfur modification protein DndB [Acidobacteriaceae bacterium]
MQLALHSRYGQPIQPAKGMLDMNIIAESTTAIPQSLGDLMVAGDSSAKPVIVLNGYNLGNHSLIVNMPFLDFLQKSEVANERGLAENKDYEGMEIAQRKLDPVHATKLATYILKGLVKTTVSSYGQNAPSELANIQKNLGSQPYLSLQPIVANIRTCEKGGTNLRAERPQDAVRVYLSDRDVLWVVDGQHRRYAMGMLLEFFQHIQAKHRFPKRPKVYPAAHNEEMGRAELQVWLEIFGAVRTSASIAVEIHLGLDADEERQLFHDLNNLGKKVDASLAFDFDMSNPVNLFIKRELVDSDFFKPNVTDTDKVDWKDDEGKVSRKDLIAVNAILFLNKTNVKGAQPAEVSNRQDVAIEFWRQINTIESFGEVGAKVKTVAAQPVVLKALAKLAFDFAFGRQQNPDHLERLLAGISKIDFKHTNPMWRYYEFSEPERVRVRIEGLAAYLPSSEDGANRDTGKYDEVAGVMRFGSKHNDIIPILGDMVRWQLELPRRPMKSGQQDDLVDDSISEGQVGIIDSIVKVLEQAKAENSPKTVDEILTFLKKSFPARDPNGMLLTIRAQLSRLPTEKGFQILSSQEGRYKRYWAA